MIIGVDYQPSFQAIAFLMEETGECGELELNHSEAQRLLPGDCLVRVKGIGIGIQAGRDLSARSWMMKSLHLTTRFRSRRILFCRDAPETKQA